MVLQRPVPPMELDVFDAEDVTQLIEGDVRNRRIPVEQLILNPDVMTVLLDGY